MDVLIAETPGIQDLRAWEPAAQDPHELSPHMQSMLTVEQEAFFLDRFNPKLEDPLTGQWIRSCCTWKKHHAENSRH